jgi:hypothetical protein
VEEVVAAILQVFLEGFLEMVVYIGLDIVSLKDENGRTYGCVLLGFFVLAGVGLGALVNWMHPNPVLPLPWLRVANLIVGPFLAGGLSVLVARWRRRDPMLHFWMAFCFVLRYDLVRFAYARA